MTKVTWVVCPQVGHRNKRDIQRLILAIRESGNSIVFYNDRLFEPDSKKDFSAIDALDSDAPTIYYGSWNALESIIRTHSKLPEPFAWIHRSERYPLNYEWKQSAYGHALRKLLLNRPGNALLPFTELLEPRYRSVFTAVARNGSVFIRPDANDKSFTGQVIKLDRLEEWWQFHANGRPRDMAQMPPDTWISINPVRQIAAEWRFVIVDGKVVTGSRYHEGYTGKINRIIPWSALRLAKRVARRWTVHPVFVCDIGKLVAEGTYKVVEIGSLNIAGLYACDVRKIVTAVNRSIIRQTQKYLCENGAGDGYSKTWCAANQEHAEKRQLSVPGCLPASRRCRHANRRYGLKRLPLPP